MERWLGSAVTGDDSRVKESGVDILEELESGAELSESSNELLDETDEELGGPWISGASYARTLVVDRSSIGNEIWARSIGRSYFLMLAIRPGIESMTLLVSRAR